MDVLVETSDFIGEPLFRLFLISINHDLTLSTMANAT